MKLRSRLVLALSLFLPNASARSAQSSPDAGELVSALKISAETPGFLSALDAFDEFGSSSVSLGDLDGDGVADLAVGAPGEAGPPGGQMGAVYVLFLRGDGTVREQREINTARGGFSGPLVPGDRFGSSLALLGDLDGDLVPELAVGAPGPVHGPFAFKKGALWILFLNADGTIHGQQRIDDSEGGFGGTLGGEDAFGSALAHLGDLDGDGIGELAVGASGDRGALGALDHPGALWILFLDADGTVKRQQKVNALEGGFTGVLGPQDRFGSSLAALGDLDGDGVTELAAGAALGSGTGNVWILFPRVNGTIETQLDVLASGFDGELGAGDSFGASLARLGDRDQDGVTELAVGAPGDDDGGSGRGAVWTLFLNADGTIRDQAKVSDTRGGFGGMLRNDNRFGSSLAVIDVDADGAGDLCVGAAGDRGPGTNDVDVGGAWLLFLDAGGAPLSAEKIDETQPALAGTLNRGDWFGASVAWLGDLDGDGTSEVALGTPNNAGRGQGRGAIWVCSLDRDGAVRSKRRISSSEGGFTGNLHDYDGFGTSLAALGDLDGDGVSELAVGAPGDDDGAGGLERGAVWILFLRSDGIVKRSQKISFVTGGFGGLLLPFDHFGASLAGLGDVDGDGVPDLAVGAPQDDDGGAVYQNRGAAWILLLGADGRVRSQQKINGTQGGFSGSLADADTFAASLARLGDLDGDGASELAVGAPGDDDGGPDRGALWILFLDASGAVEREQKISALEGGFGGALEHFDSFGKSCAALEDLDGDGTRDLAAGFTGLGSVPQASGVWLLFLRPDGTVHSERRIDSGSAGLSGAVDGTDAFGWALTSGGDLNQDGLRELAIGAPQDDDGGLDQGALWLLALDGLARIDFETEDDLRTPLANGQALTNGDEFGRCLALGSSGAHLGPAAFDSERGGPNDPGPNKDLLVGRGNLLLLQDSLAPAQSVPGFFDQPDDDPDGGTLLFSFARAVEVWSIDLIDIDVDAGELVSVTLLDARGRARSYRVPAGWTGDLRDGAPGVGTLDLTTLDPQPGFRSSATASEMPGFDPRLVLKLQVELAGSSALDDLLLGSVSAAEGDTEARPGGAEMSVRIGWSA